MAEIADYVAKIEAERDCTVPCPDPDSGMEQAKVLFLHHSPNKAAEESGLVSGANKDTTAPLMMKLLSESGIAVKDTIGWNLVPWLLAEYRRPTRQDKQEGLPYLQGVMEYLPDLQVVCLLGNHVREFKEEIEKVIPPRIEIYECKMPSRQAIKREGSDAWQETLAVYKEIASKIYS